MKPMRWAFAATVAAAAIAAAILAPATAEEKPPVRSQLWVYAPLNFQVNERVDELITLMGRARKAGYTGMLVGDHKFGDLRDRPKHYYANLERARKAAADLGLDLIAGVMPVAYSNSLLMRDPNLAEGIAVRDCPMIVRDGKAVADGQANLLENGSFETPPAGRKTPGWDWMDECASRDTSVRHSGEASLRMDKFRDGGRHGNGRVVRKLALAPWRQYRVDLWIKTDGVSGAGEVRVSPIAADRTLNFTNLGAKATQDWKQHSILFNTMENAEVSLYIGIWGGRDGTLWLDDIAVREVAGVNMLRRQGCPMRVTSEDGTVAYEEGRDFQRWEYPKMGRVPWSGEYEPVHPEPPIVITKDSRIKDGDRLNASFYHTVTIYDGQVSACLRHEDVFKYMEETVLAVKKYLAPQKYMMSHDELRVAGHCELCRRPGETAGQVLAENVKRCREIIRRADPRAEVFVWSDMFDPHHNARDKYYLVPSTLEGAWEGLGPDVRIALWYFEKRMESAEFFTNRGHKYLMAGYYDGADVKANAFGWRDTAEKFPGALGLMYTTWRNDYSRLEEFARFATEPR